MASRVLPIVRLLFACDEAVCRSADEKWVLTNPWAVVALPPGATFPFDVNEMWVYTQLAEGVGEFDLVVEMRLILPDESRKVIHRGKSVRVTFPTARQLGVIDTAFRLTLVPFDEPGIYEFQVLANYAELQGQTTLVRVLDARDKP